MEQMREGENLAGHSQVPRDSKAPFDPVVPRIADAKVAHMSCAVPANRKMHHNSEALQSFEIWSLATQIRWVWVS